MKNNKILKNGRCLICMKTKISFVSAEEAKEGGFIFSIPAILGALGAAGSLAGGASAIASAVNKKKADDKLIAETKRHNEAMEAKKGSGLRLIPAKKNLHRKKILWGRSLLESAKKIIPIKPLTQHDLKHYLRVLKVPAVRDIFMRDTLPSSPFTTERGILNLDVQEGTGTHWTCWYKENDTCYYFDSYGLTCPNEFKTYMNNCNIFWSAYKIQKMGDVICGHLCLEILKRLEYERFDSILLDLHRNGY